MIFFSSCQMFCDVHQVFSPSFFFLEMDTYKSLHDGNCHFQKSTEKTCVNYVVEWRGIFVTRCQGQNDEPPEMVLNWKLSATTLLGVGISLSAISYLSAFFGPEGEQSFLVMMLGSYGALASSPKKIVL